jgi:hypothetical protein
MAKSSAKFKGGSGGSADRRNFDFRLSAESRHDSKLDAKEFLF